MSARSITPVSSYIRRVHAISPNVVFDFKIEKTFCKNELYDDKRQAFGDEAAASRIYNVRAAEAVLNDHELVGRRRTKNRANNENVAVQASPQLPAFAIPGSDSPNARRIL